MTIPNLCISATAVALLLCLRTGFSDIVIAPSTREVQLGGSTYFNCSTSVTSKEVHWFHYPVSSTERSFVYGFETFYERYLGRFAMDKIVITGEYNLVITSVVPEDAGKYECQDDTGAGMKKSAHLIILETDLTCQSNVNVQKVIGPNSCNIEPDQLILICTAQYIGNEAPILQWELNDTNESISNGVTRQISGNFVIYNLTMTTDKLSDGSFYSCRTTRSTSKLSCKSGSVQVVGSTQEQGSPCAEDNCKSWKSAFVCILILLLLSIGVLACTLILRYKERCSEMANRSVFRRKKMSSSNKPPELSDYSDQKEQEPLTPTKDETNEVDQNRADAPDVKKLMQSSRSGESNSRLKSKIEALENDIQQQDQTIKENNRTIKGLKQKDNSKTEKITSLLLENDQLQVKVKENDRLRAKVKENDQLRAKVKDLEQRLYPKGDTDYAEKPTLAHTIITDAAKQRQDPLTGMAILGNEFFVSHENDSVIEVYDSETFQFGRILATDGISHPMDIASCKIANCLYIIFREDSESESHIRKFEPKGERLGEWSTGGECGRLSTYESNVIVCLFEEKLINEFNGDGKLLQTVSLSPAVGFHHPWHAIKITNSHFVVCHGDTKDELHRVCIVDDQGTIKKEFRKWQTETKERKLNVPICLLEDNGGRSILVVDRDNKKIRHLNCFLQRKDNLISETDGYPVRICLDERKGRLFVAENTLRSNKKEWKGGRIQVFNIR